MAGTRAGGLKAAKTLRAKDGNFYAKIGAKGGQAEVTKGFGKNKKLASIAGKKGGRVRRYTTRIEVTFL